jgi:predicted flap endonuclease-1-like 5' DNA nuclease
MFDDMTEVLVLLALGLFIGVIISWFYWSRLVGRREEKLEEYENLNNEKDTELKKLTSDLADLREAFEARENTVESLNKRMQDLTRQVAESSNQISENHDVIGALKGDLEDLEKEKQDQITRADGAETMVADLEKAFNEKELEVTKLESRIRAMQDDFTILNGIGPKVSTILRANGITSFVKLADSSVEKIKDILAAENPNLLRLTDPSNWPEQAQLASVGKWKSLSTLQNQIRETRRT